MIQFQLSDFPEFRQLSELCQKLAAEVVDLRALLPEWIDQVEAERLTGHSRTTLHRLRKAPKSLIRWKSDRGVRYLRSSLITHNNSRALGGRG